MIQRLSKSVFTLNCKLKDCFLLYLTLSFLRFKHKNPEDTAEVPNGFLTDCNEDTLKILKSYCDKSLLSAKVHDKFQFERVGFFSIDPDSSSNKVGMRLS